MADILRQSEENSNLLRTMSSDAQRLRDEQQQRINSLEQRLGEMAAAASVAPPVASDGAPPTKPTQPKPGQTKPAIQPPAIAASAPPAPAGDPGEDAYTEGFKLWEGGQYQPAITSLRAFTAAYPKHRRVSYANNLIGRALLDQGQARAAAEALLANYRGNPRGERAADSLYYLGQALMRLGQPGQACKAYDELDSVYGSKVRADLRKLVDEGKASAKCS
jgi:TolA-binding protein